MKQRRSKLDVQADSLIHYFRKRAQRGYPESRRDALYGPARIPPGGDSDSQLDEVIRHTKDRGSKLEPVFELVYVYARPPVWTCEPTQWVRDRALIEELKREAGGQRRWVRIATPVDSVVSGVAGGVLMSVEAGYKILAARSSDEEPVGDLVLARIDAQGIAN
jgi:hypothetical protein